MIAVRAARGEDAAAIAAIYAPYVLSGTISFETVPPTADQMLGRMTASAGLYPWLVATDGEDGPVLGYAYAGKFRERPAYRFAVETSIYLSDAVAGRGIGRRLYGALLDTLRAQGFMQAVSVIALPNDASIALHRTLGFHRIGANRGVGYKNERWIDVDVWQRELNRAAVPPAEPRPFSDVGVARV